jgi:hypothetical protein
MRQTVAPTLHAVAFSFMERVVWLAGWEWQCCGRPFRGGDHVEWPLRSLIDREWLRPLLGADLVETITDEETHHGLAGPDPVATRGVVERITAVFWDYAPREGDASGTEYPVEGSARFEDREEADAWEGGASEFAGYLVTLSTR